MALEAVRPPLVMSMWSPVSDERMSVPPRLGGPGDRQTSFPTSHWPPVAGLAAACSSVCDGVAGARPHAVNASSRAAKAASLNPVKPPAIVIDDLRGDAGAKFALFRLCDDRLVRPHLSRLVHVGVVGADHQVVLSAVL